MPPASSNVDSRLADKPPRLSKLPALRGSMSIPALFSLDFHRPGAAAVPAVALYQSMN